MHTPQSTSSSFENVHVQAAHAEAPPALADVHAFDFLVGTWAVHHRRLKRRLAGDDNWVEFGGRSRLRAILGGLGNIDENVIGLPDGAYEAVSLRLFDASLQRWSIWWVDGRNPCVDTPMHGGFTDGVGTFFGDDVFEGRPIAVRFIWSAITPRSARWEQAFSEDRGQTWETNWVMDFERLE